MSQEEIDQITARLEAARKCAPWGTHARNLWATKETPGHPAAVWYGDNDQCAEVHGNLGLGIDGDAMAVFFAHSLDDVQRLLLELARSAK